MFVVYIIFSEKLNKFYTGMTSNFDIRLSFHLNDNQTRKFTYKADDWELFLKIDCNTKSQAIRIEKHIKSMKSKVYIKNLVEYPEISAKILEKFADC